MSNLQERGWPREYIEEERGVKALEEVVGGTQC